jgi:cellulose synthase/poly-beta-1,6-N-acetylglucosamine synthase-like glycosyltransferase
MDHLPVYTVLVPAYREPEVVTRLLGALGRIEYPPARLDVKLLLEEDDEVTIEAVRAADTGSEVEVVLVPAGEPRTKPKALNYGLTLARGEMITIYDAEDLPDPLQLRRAVVAFSRHGPDVGCIQAKLSFDNIDQNLITRWFSIEYAMWFSFFLPGLVRYRAPLPLGGTSNHMRRHVVEELGGWDPHNVTEDADLGIRLHRHGYQVGVLESTTLEEANSDFVNWVKQRSRWYKGYFQTWLVHMREPRSLWRDLGWRGFCQFNLFVGGTPVLALLNPVFWSLTIVWFVGKPAVIQELFPAPVFYAGLVCWAFGNFTIAYLSIISARIMGRAELVFAAMLSPLYWVMMSLAATKAFVQLASAPSFWEKTTHGLSHRAAAVTLVQPGGEPTV